VLDLNGLSQTLDMLSVTNGVLRNGASSSQSILTIAGTAGAHPTNSLILNDVNNVFDVPAVDAELDISGIVNGAGSFIKTGLGTLSLQGSNNYTGNVTVGAGTLVIAFPDLINTTVVTISNAAVMNLNFPNGETDVIAGLTINGVSKAPGVYNNSTDPTFILGSGSLQVVTVANPVNPNPGAILVSGSGGVLGLGWPTNAGWILQSNSVSLTATNFWFAYPNSTNLTNVSIPIDPTLTNVFYRLLRPF